MKIAQIAPIIERVPPKKYGGTERVIHALTEELVKRGHEVTLFASGDSLTSARLVSSHYKSLRESKFLDMYGSNPYSLLNYGKAYEMQDEFDIIHDHLGELSLPTANLSKTPVVMTLHGAFTVNNRVLYKEMKNPYYVTISDAQSKPLPDLNYAGTVYNGLNMDDYPFTEEPDDYLLFVGRISREKGTHYAIEVAQYLSMPLIIAAKLDPSDIPYFKEYVEPRLSEEIQWIGEVDTDERNQLMSKAKAFLHPVTWREPFGLTLIEAMACGCPVIAFRRGSIPEIIKEGKTGFIVEDMEEMIEAVTRIDEISREECRKYSLHSFSAKGMVDKYEKIYKDILSGKIKRNE